MQQHVIRLWDLPTRLFHWLLAVLRTSDWLTGLHHQGIWIIGSVITLHIAAVLFHTRVHKDDLITPMLTGMKQVAAPGARSATGGGWLALIAAVALAILAVWIAAGGLLPPPPPMAPVPSVPSEPDPVTPPSG